MVISMGSPAGIEITSKEQAEIRLMMKEVDDKGSFRAMTGVLLRSEGKGAREVAESLGTTKKQVFTWCRKYKFEGLPGLIFKKPTGRPALEGKKAKRRIPALLKTQPADFGYLKGRWVLRDISKQLKEEGINISYPQVGRVLKDLGIPLRRPKLRAPGSIKKNYAKRKQIRNYKKIGAALEKKGS